MRRLWTRCYGYRGCEILGNKQMFEPKEISRGCHMLPRMLFKWWAEEYFQGRANSGETSFYQLETTRKTLFYFKNFKVEECFKNTLLLQKFQIFQKFRIFQKGKPHFRRMWSPHQFASQSGLCPPSSFWGRWGSLFETRVANTLPFFLQRCFFNAPHFFLYNTFPTIDLSLSFIGEDNVWYQNNLYNCTFPAMIKDWRKSWTEGTSGQTDPEFPFGFVQVQRSVGWKFPDTTILQLNAWKQSFVNHIVLFTR